MFFGGTIKNFFVFLILSFISLSMFAQPEWYRNPASADPQNLYFRGSGQGSSQQIAINNARSDVAKHLTANVRIANTRTRPVSFNANYTDYIMTFVNSAAEDILRFSEILRQSSDGATHYVMVAINKSKCLIELENEISRHWEQTLSSLELASTNRLNGSIVTALYNLADAQKNLSELVARKYIYDALSTTPYHITGLITHDYIEREVIGLVGSITFSVVSGNQQSARRGTRLSEPIVFRASLRRVGFATRNIVRLPVRVSYGDGSQITTGFTNYNGLFSINAMANPQSGNNGKVRIAVNTSMLPSYYDQKLRHKTGVAFFHARNTDVLRAHISVRDLYGDTIPMARTQISSLLMSHQIRHYQNAPYFIRGRASVVDENIIEGEKPTQYISNVAVDIEYGINETNRIVSIIRATGRGVSIRSFEDAQQLAYQNLVISHRDISLMIDRLVNFVETVETARYIDFNDEHIVISVGNPSHTNLTHGVYTFREDPDVDMNLYEPNSYLYRPRAMQRRTLLDTYISRIEVFPEYIYVYFENKPSGGRGSGSDGAGTWYPSGSQSPKLINLENNSEVENIGYRSSPSGYIVNCVFPNPRDGSFDNLRFSLTRGTLRFEVIDLSRAIFTPHEDR
jgi:hypothetical protein